MNSQAYVLKDLLPLIVILSVIGAITFGHQLMYGFDARSGMRILMASFFLVFGSFKIMNLAGFATAYAKYDLIAKQFPVYGYVYPFLEIGLGLAYLFSWNLWHTNVITLCLMLVSAAGVFNELKEGKEVMCACLGVVFKIPMTYVTLLEDLLMAAMAAWMLL